ncbi:ETX/MTX2 family pore-forming toxin [Spiroplasma sp. ChiS]|uniref:ETX/MTX2 family pore-forming toxin n=1 Tax=Spiroplasma sp. ChiS TaxID=2099885 RepID=UPI0013923B16|nr:ETX/MTX2 family pore-forming toxin [Spiroplasma sp. ChiS]
MKKLLSLVGTGILATSVVAPLVANTKYQPNTTDQLTLSYTEQQIKNDELPIPNAGNWDLSTGQGFFKYFRYCINYLEWGGPGPWVPSISVGNKMISLGNWFWDENEQQNWVEQGKGIVNISEITNKSKNELDHAHDVLINKNDQKQTLSTSSYSHQQTVGNSLKLGMKIGTTIDIDAYVVGTKISAEISAEGTWTDTVTDTYNATTQKITVPAHSEIYVDYFFYKTVDQVDTWVYQKYNLDQRLHFLMNHVSASDFKVYELFDNIKKYENTDWIFNIPNGYVQKIDGDYYIKTLPISYENDGTEFKVNVGPSKPFQ